MGFSHLVNKNILVTGGFGLVGSHLVEKLINYSRNVVVPYRSIHPKSHFAFKNLFSKVITVVADLKDQKRVSDIVKKYEIDYIFHLAAQPIVETAYHNPIETFETNILGTAYILEAARLYGKIKGIIVASSDKAYGEVKSGKYKETDPLAGDHPYDTSKAGADLIARAYYATYGLPVVVTRFGNIYGPGDLNFNRIIPGIIRAQITGETLEVRSNGKYVRDYVYVKDVADGYLAIAEKLDEIKGEAFNFSSDDTYSVLDLIVKVETIVGKKVNFKILNLAVNEIPYQSLSYAKAKRLLGWRPKYNLEKGMPETYDWYANFFFAT